MDSHHSHNSPNTLVTSAQATLHCLTGCVVGEVTGLIIAVLLGLGVWATIALATTLAYISGFYFGLRPVMRRENRTLVEAFKLIWVGETLSIGVMEIAMNATDYAMGGMEAGSLLAPIFWISIAVAIPIGFLVAWPVNWWLLKRNLKACH